MKWKFEAERDITATPSVFKGRVYFPSWDGYLYALKQSDGSLIWKQNLQQLTGINSTGVIFNVNVTASRTTPTIADDLLIIGISGPAFVVAVKQSNGELVWSTQLDDNPTACITMSGTYHNGLVLLTFYFCFGILLSPSCSADLLTIFYSKVQLYSLITITSGFFIKVNVNEFFII